MLLPPRKRLSKVLLVSLLASASLYTPAAAQELFPVIEDQSTHTGMPNDGRFSILEFSLLQDTHELDAAIIATGYEVDFISDHEVRGLRDGSGNQVSFRYGPLQAKLRKPMENGRDIVNIRLTSSLLGNRVSTLRRNVRPEQEYDLQAVLDGIENKYGQPSLIENGSHSLRYTYLFNDGELLQSPDGKTRTPEIRACYSMRNAFPTGEAEQEYSYSPNRPKRYPECSGGIHVTLSYGARKDLIKQMEIIMYDYDLIHRDLVTQDQFLLDALNKEITSKVGGGAPKL